MSSESTPSRIVLAKTLQEVSWNRPRVMLASQEVSWNRPRVMLASQKVSWNRPRVMLASQKVSWNRVRVTSASQKVSLASHGVRLTSRLPLGSRSRTAVNSPSWQRRTRSLVPKGAARDAIAARAEVGGEWPSACPSRAGNELSSGVRNCVARSWKPQKQLGLVALAPWVGRVDYRDRPRCADLRCDADLPGPHGRANDPRGWLAPGGPSNALTARSTTAPARSTAVATA